MILLAVLAAGTIAVADAPLCLSDSTQEVDACLQAQLDRADADLARYVAAARKRIREDHGKDATALEASTLLDFDKAETAWAAYVKAECGAVYDNWSSGTIRTSMELTCALDLTRRHTHTVWSNWLTYMDSTPPILPEPPRPDAASD
jgi:uncharacterized protein YecT (DUF1311 family)